MFQRFGLLVLIAAGVAQLNPAPQLQPNNAHAATKAAYKKAMKACRKKYGKRVFKVTFKTKTKFICHYHTKKSSKQMTEQDVREWCKKKYAGFALSYRIIKKRGKWYCYYRH